MFCISILQNSTKLQKITQECHKDKLSWYKKCEKIIAVICNSDSSIPIITLKKKSQKYRYHISKLSPIFFKSKPQYWIYQVIKSYFSFHVTKKLLFSNKVFAGIWRFPELYSVIFSQNFQHSLPECNDKYRANDIIS